ncbi:MAG: proteobacterial dedicated sortase system response regulator [Pseudomonadota bacterium]
MNRTVAIIEDDPRLRENYCDVLQRNGLHVIRFAARPAAWEAMQNSLPDMAIIDITLAGEPEGGFELCRDLRGLSPQLPIIFLTARDSELDVVSGLRLGADDYLVKDISMEQLVARVIALFRRQDALKSDSQRERDIQHGDLRINEQTLAVVWQGEPVDLTVTEFWIVHALARFPGQVKSRQQLMDAANTVLDDSTVTSHVKRIRKKFLAIDKEFSAIKTAYGYGYRWIQS